MEQSNLADLLKTVDFPKGFRLEVCKIGDDGKIVCKGTLNNKKTICEIRQNGSGKPEVACSSVV
jgi:hypothetical protein